MKEPRWKDAFGRVPDSFSARVEGTLNEMNRMEGRQTMKRKIAWRAALAAVLALAILTGTALALALVKSLAQQERYADAATVLEEKVKRLKQRRAEAKAHARNVKKGKKK